MFSEGGRAAARVLIASAQAGVRTTLMDVVSSRSGVKVVGFIRSADHLVSRTVASGPDIVLVDEQLIRGDGTVLLRLQKQVKGLKTITQCADHAEVRQSPEHSPVQHHELATALDVILKGCEQARVHHVRMPLPGDPDVPVQPRCAKPRAVVLASSTGGPLALTTVIRMLPQDFPLPIAVVQHMPPGFTSMLAERLNKASSLEVMEGAVGMEFIPGRVVIGAGDFHLKLRGKPGQCFVQLDRGEREHSCRPAANVLFRSAADVFGGSVLTVVLTGMGRDGFEGARQLHGQGSRVIVQDAATSTVWGMPGAIAQAGFADAVLPLHEIADELMRSL